jgi:olfactory receptor
MKEENESFTTDFTLLGVTRQREQEYFFFILFLFFYPITVIENVLIILASSSPLQLSPRCWPTISWVAKAIYLLWGM